MPQTAGCGELRQLPLVTLYLSERCNSRCAGCDYWRHGRADVSLDAVRTMLPELAALRTRHVLISGGEPLLNPEWPLIAGLLRAHEMRLWLLTSGLSLAKHAAQVAQLFDTVTVSLDGAQPATYRATRGVDAFAAVCRGISAIARRGVATTIRVTVQRANFRELGQLVDLARALGAARISFLAADISSATAFGRQGAPSVDVALASGDLHELEEQIEHLCANHAADFSTGFIAESPAKLRRLLQYYRALHGLGPFPAVRCNAPEFSAVVDATGRVRPCFFIPGPSGDAGPVGLADALNGHGMPQLRSDIRDGQRDECRRCVCSMWRDPANPAAELPA